MTTAERRFLFAGPSSCRHRVRRRLNTGPPNVVEREVEQQQQEGEETGVGEAHLGGQPRRRRNAHKGRESQVHWCETRKRASERAGPCARARVCVCGFLPTRIGAAVFKQFDKDGSGDISTSELDKALQSCGFNFQKARLAPRRCVFFLCRRRFSDGRPLRAQIPGSAQWLMSLVDLDGTQSLSEGKFGRCCCYCCCYLNVKPK